MTDRITALTSIMAFVDEYPDERRHPLTAESADWARLNAILKSFGWLYGGCSVVDIGPGIRILLEICYVMGYERGKAERPLNLAFTVEEVSHE